MLATLIEKSDFTTPRAIFSVSKFPAKYEKAMKRVAAIVIEMTEIIVVRRFLLMFLFASFNGIFSPDELCPLTIPLTSKSEGSTPYCLIASTGETFPALSAGIREDTTTDRNPRMAPSKSDRGEIMVAKPPSPVS